jgi:hypothetical protein
MESGLAAHQKCSTFGCQYVAALRILREQPLTRRERPLSHVSRVLMRLFQRQAV